MYFYFIYTSVYIFLYFYFMFVLGSNVFEDPFFVDQFLGYESSRCQHGQSSVLEFFGGHFGKFGIVVWLKSQWIETDITWEVIFLEDSLPIASGFTWLFPSRQGTLKFSRT